MRFLAAKSLDVTKRKTDIFSLLPPPVIDNTPEKEVQEYVSSRHTVQGQWAPLKLFIQEVSVIGLKYIVLSQSYFRRLVWFCMVLSATVFCFYQVWDRCNYFFSRPLVTSVRIRRPETEEIRFPTVTLCSENRVMKSKAESIGGERLVNDFKSIYHIFDLWASRGIPHIDEDVPWKNDWGTLYDNVSHDTEETIRFFKWNGVVYNNGRDHTTIPVTKVKTDIGRCFRFNTDKQNFATRVSGSVYGLVMAIKVHHAEYLVPTTDSVSSGIRIALHSPKTVPQMKKDAFKLGPGYQHFVAVNVHETIDPGPPDVNCSLDASYSYTQCLLDCETAYFIDICKCKDYHMKGDAPVCSLEQHARCGLEAYISYVTKNKEKSCGCLRECTYTRYSWSVSSAAVSQPIVLNTFPHLVDWDYFNKDHLVVNIYLEDISYEEIRTVLAYPTLAVLCDIGGALGLFLGSTFLTVMEILDFILVNIYSVCMAQIKV